MLGKRLFRFVSRVPALLFIVFLAIAVTFAACATTSSGPTIPAGSALSQIIGQNVLMNDPTVLALYITTDCNAAAAAELRASIAVCSGGLASVAGGAIIPANVVSGIDLACQIFGYTNAQNQLAPTVPTSVVPGPPAACLNPPAPATLNLPPLKKAV